MAKKAKKKAEFNPSWYKHLHSKTPKEVWAAEFLSRNSDFLELWDELERSYNNDSSYDNFDLHILFERIFSVDVFGVPSDKEIPKAKGYPRRGLSSGKPLLVTLHSPVNYTLVTDSEHMKQVVKYPKSSIGRKNFEIFKTEENKSIINIDSSLRWELEKLSNPENFLLISLDLGRSPISINKALDGLKGTVRSLIKSKEDPKNIDKWKYYLVVYDLLEAKYRYRDVAEVFLEHFSMVDEITPENMNDFNRNSRVKKNIGNYRDAAKALIEGGYQKYI